MNTTASIRMEQETGELTVTLPDGRIVLWMEETPEDMLREFELSGVTHVVWSAGMENSLYGDLQDGRYTVEEWIEWLRFLRC